MVNTFDYQLERILAYAPSRSINSHQQVVRIYYSKDFTQNCGVSSGSVCIFKGFTYFWQMCTLKFNINAKMDVVRMFVHRSNCLFNLMDDSKLRGIGFCFEILAIG